MGGEEVAPDQFDEVDLFRDCPSKTNLGIDWVSPDEVGSDYCPIDFPPPKMNLVC